jgi:hypothetical protein
MRNGRMRIAAWVAAGIVAGVVVAACTGPSATPAVLGVVVPGGDRAVEVGRRIALEADVEVSGGASTNVVWTAEDEAVATVSAAGVVTGVAPGVTTVTATSEVDAARSATVAVQVQAIGDGDVRWTVQFGTAETDAGLGVAIAGGSRVAVAGWTRGDLAGANAGETDAFVRVLDGATPTWTRQFGTFTFEYAHGVAIGGDGRVVVAGQTRSQLPGQTGAGVTDAFVRTYDADGVEVWTRQFGTVNGDSADAVAVAADGRIAVAGDTTGALNGPSAGGSDAFVRVYDRDGDLRWARQFGTDGGDGAAAVAFLPGGGVVVAGHVSGDLAGSSAGQRDAFLRRYDDAGEVVWTRQFGAVFDDEVRAVAVGPGGRIAVVGLTRAGLDGGHAGGSDAFVRLYGDDGTLLWGRQFGTPSADQAHAVAIDAVGNVLVGGFTEGSLIGVGVGDRDAFVRKYEPDGTLRWTKQFGTPQADSIAAVAVDLASGDLVVAGRTSGGLAGPSVGGSDVFLRRIGP